MSERLAAVEAAARARLDPAVVDFFAGGSGDETSLGEAVRAWQEWRLVPRVLRDVSRVDTSCKLLGATHRSPVLVAPTAFHTLVHPDGEVATAAGAARAGSLYVMSTRATRSIEQVAPAAGRPWWFQVYVLRDRGLTEGLVKRAVAAGASALVLTGDTPIVGSKARASGPLPLGDAEYLVNLRPHLGEAAADLESRTTQDPGLTEEAIGWLADLSGLPVLVKGVLRPDDARRCVGAGAAGIVVSNHGGRQLDGALASAAALPRVVDEVGGEVPVLVDGGIRDGRGALKALCLGASAVMLGRPILWGLACGGAGGVHEVLETVRAELVDSMMLAGVTSLAGCERSLVEHRPLPGEIAGERP